MPSSSSRIGLVGAVVNFDPERGQGKRLFLRGSVAGFRFGGYPRYSSPWPAPDRHENTEAGTQTVRARRARIAKDLASRSHGSRPPPRIPDRSAGLFGACRARGRPGNGASRRLSSLSSRAESESSIPLASTIGQATAGRDGGQTSSSRFRLGKVGRNDERRQEPDWKERRRQATRPGSRVNPDRTRHVNSSAEIANQETDSGKGNDS